MPPKKDDKGKGGAKDKGKAAGGAKGGKADKGKSEMVGKVKKKKKFLKSFQATPRIKQAPTMLSRCDTFCARSRPRS